MFKYRLVIDHKSIKIGDVVCLKSDKNRLMTVNCLHPSIAQADCIWFNLWGELQNKTIRIDSLFLVLEDED